MSAAARPAPDPARVHMRRLTGGLAVAAMLAGGLIPLAELHGTAAGIALIAAVVAAALHAAYVVFDTGTLALAIMVGVSSATFGGPDAPTPRISSLVGGLLVFLAAELGRLSLDQRSPVELAEDPSVATLRPALLVLGGGAAAGAAALLVAVVRLPSAGVLAALGAIALVLLAAILAHPGTMLGGALDDPLDEPGADEVVAPR